MLFDLQDAEFCALFIEAADLHSQEAQAAFASAKALAKLDAPQAFGVATTIGRLDSPQTDSLTKFIKEWSGKAEEAKAELSSRLDLYARRYEYNKKQEDFWQGMINQDTLRYRRLAKEAQERGRTILWNLVSIAFGSKNDYALSFIQEFASRMHIDAAVAAEFTDTLEAKAALRSMRSWAQSALSADEAAEVAAQCGEDWNALKMSINNLIDLG